MEPTEEKKSFNFLPGFLRKSRLIAPSIHSSIDIPPNTDPRSFELKTYPQAWLALFLLVLLRTAVSVFQFTFSIIPQMTGEFFSASLTAVNWFASIQCLIYVLMSFFTGYIFEKLGVKRSVSLFKDIYHNTGVLKEL